MRISKLTNLAKKINPNLYWSFASKGLAAVGFFTVDILIARKLGVTSYGQWTTFYSILLILQGTLAFGIPQASQSLNARLKGKPELKGQLTASLISQASTSFILLIILFFSRNFIAEFYNQPFYADLLLIGLPYLFLYSGVDNFKFNFVGLQKVQNHFILNFFEFGLKVSLVFLFLNSTPAISDVISAYSLSVFVPYIIGLGIILKIIRSSKNKPIFKDSVKTLLNLSLPFALLVFLLVINKEMNIQMLAFLTNSQEVAMLGVGKQITSKIPQLTMAIGMGTIPKLAIINKENFLEKKKYLYRIFSANLIVNFVVFIIFFIAAPFIINILYGGQFADAILPFRINLVFVLIASMHYYLSLFIDVQGETRKRVIISLFSIVILFLTSLVLIPLYGAIGAAISSVISVILSSIYTFVITKKLLQKLKDLPI